MKTRGLLSSLVLVLTLSQPVFADLLYDFQWRSYARLSRWVGDELQSNDGELGDSATLTLRRASTGEWAFTFQGPAGKGRGVLAPRGPDKLVFPIAVSVGRPPAPSYLKGGSFTFTGDPDCPQTFQVEYVEGFLCRTVATACGRVNRWERSLTGQATLARGDRRCPQRSP